MGQLAKSCADGFNSLAAISFGTLLVLAGMVSGPVFAAEIIILRTLPPHNVLEQPLPPNATQVIAAPTERRELILSLVPGEKMLGDGEFGAVLASPPPGGNASGLQTEVLGHPIDSSGGVSDLPGMGMGTFASTLGGLGGQITGQVTGQLNSAMQGLSGALNPGGGQ